MTAEAASGRDKQDGAPHARHRHSTPTSGQELRSQRIAAALRAMLAQLEARSLEPVATGDGLSVVLEHDGLRCLLAVSQAPRHTLSPRELQIARLVAEGATNRAIGSLLDISPWTVSTHVRRIFAKLDVGSRAEMVARFFGEVRPFW